MSTITTTDIQAIINLINTQLIIDQEELDCASDELSYNEYMNSTEVQLLKDNIAQYNRCISYLYIQKTLEEYGVSNMPPDIDWKSVDTPPVTESREEIQSGLYTIDSNQSSITLTSKNIEATKIPTGIFKLYNSIDGEQYSNFNQQKSK